MTEKSIDECEGSIATEHLETSANNDNEIVKQIKNHYKNQTQKPFVTNIHCYKTHKLIGKGSFGKVALATHKLTNKKVAIKRIEKRNMQEDQV